MSSAVLNISNLSHHLTGYISSVGDEWMSSAVLNNSNLSHHLTGYISSVGDEWMSPAVLNNSNLSHHLTGYISCRWWVNVSSCSKHLQPVSSRDWLQAPGLKGQVHIALQQKCWTISLTCVQEQDSKVQYNCLLLSLCSFFASTYLNLLHSEIKQQRFFH